MPRITTLAQIPVQSHQQPSLKVHTHTHKLICDIHIAANKGIGFEITRLLAEAGLTVIMTSRSGG